MKAMGTTSNACHFNSIKVQLELNSRYAILHFLDFNSIKVQLERLHQRWSRLHLAFQFHKGTIRTR